MVYGRVFVRELKIVALNGYSIVQIAFLFTVIIATALFILPPECIKESVPCIFWICGISVMQISARATLEEEYHSGALEQLLIQDLLPEVMVFFKIVAHWICIAAPISLISAFVDLIVLENGISHAIRLGICMSAGLLVTNFISSVGHALVLGSERGLVVAQVLIFPIIVPVIIYFNLLAHEVPGSKFCLHSVTLLGLSMICLIPAGIFFVLSAIKLAVEQDT